MTDVYGHLNLRPHQDQPAPTKNDSTPIWELVIADMHARDKLGRERYGTPLQAHNGRDALRDAYEEALDIAVYLRQAIAERESKGWQPIETAPKEWGSYLVWHEKYGMETLWFQLKDGGSDGRKAGNWYSEDGNEDFGEFPLNQRVSHWMPLPEAPK